jgi:uncharacterized protein YjlB
MTMLTSSPYPQKPHTLLLPPNGSIPNNEKLPALIYTGVLPASDDLASTAEALLTRNGWPTEWRDIVLPYHHYHSTAHEVLAAVAGEGHLTLGGEDGLQVIVCAGDVLVLPTGFGHKGGCHSDDFLLVGGYPPGQHRDLCTESPDDTARHRMESLCFPATDPVFGASGPLVRLWRR